MRKWSEVEPAIFTAEEIRESRLRVDIVGELIKARDESGVKQPIISRMEAGETIPRLETAWAK
jgi:predicted transcriptional regulator